MTWTRDEAITLRNKAAERAQRCAAVVQEAEECEVLVALLDEILGVASSPAAERLRELSPVTSDELDANVTKQRNNG